MSMDTFSLGDIRPPSGSCDDERGKRLKSDQEPEPELESGLSSEPESESGLGSESESETDSETEAEREKAWDRLFGWDLIPSEDLKVSDLSSRFDDHPYPFYYSCPKFTYENEARRNIRKQEEDNMKALAVYLESSRNVSPFDVIDVPSFGNISSNLCIPRPATITDDRLPHFIHLSKLALDNYNNNPDNQVVKYEFKGFIKATRQFSPAITYYITFEAKPEGVENCPATTFQARVWDRTPSDPSSEPPVVESCSIKT